MDNKTESKEKMYLLLGLFLGALFGIIGNFISGYYFYSLDHPEQPEWKLYSIISFIVTFILFVFILGVIRKFDKRSR